MENKVRRFQIVLFLTIAFFIGFLVFIISVSTETKKLETTTQTGKLHFIIDISTLDQTLALAEKENNPPYDIELEGELQLYTINLCSEYGVNPEVVFAVMYAESNFNNKAKNGDCVGIMQIKKSHLSWLKKEIGTNDLKDVFQNIEAGIYILSNHFNKYGDYHKALVCYNYGETNAKNIIASNYSKKVMAYAENLGMEV